MHFVLLYPLLIFKCVVFAQNGPMGWTTSPFNAPSFPLAVKTPYVNAWGPQGNTPAPMSNSWAKIGSPYFTPMGWYTIITVDGKPYQLMGGQNFAGMDIANQTSVTMTPTRTSFLLEAGNITVNATYLSPVVPNDLVQQSLPFSYYYLSITSDGLHEVKNYSDISGEWMGGDNHLQSNWSATNDGSVVYLQTQLVSPTPFQELNDRPLDGIAYHAMLSGDNVSWKIEECSALRSSFANGTALDNSVDPSFHAVGVPFDTLAIAVDLGTIQTTSEPIVWAIGVVRDPVIRFTNSKSQAEDRKAYYWSAYHSVRDAILGFLNNFENALSDAIALDNRILHDGSQISTEYYDLLALSTRQAMGAIDYTIGQDSAGNLNTSDVKAFMRGAGLIGSGGINCVDVIYAASPIFLYLNPNVLGYLLRPLLEYQESSLYPNAFAAIDIGTNYSMATGNNIKHDEGVEQSGNMLILTYAYAQRSGDTSLLSQHYNLLRGWADYLVNNSIALGSQRPSASDFMSATNQTNLALKGIIGIGAMSKISSVVGRSGDADYYENIASSYIHEWRMLAFSSNSCHVMTQYGQNDSFPLLYNLYAHKLLQLDLIPTSDFDTQTAFYKSKIDPSHYGLPLDSNFAEISRSDWMMFTAAIATDDILRDALVSQLHAYASSNLQNQPFEVVYNPITGEQISGASSPAQGAMFALLANNIPTVLIPSAISKDITSTGKHHWDIGAIVGGAIAVTIVVGGSVIVLHRWRTRVGCTFDRMKIIKRVTPSAFSPFAALEPYDLSIKSRSPNTEDLPTLPLHCSRLTSSASLSRNHAPSSKLSPPSTGPLPHSDVLSNFHHQPESNAIHKKQRLPRLTHDVNTTEPNPGHGPLLTRTVPESGQNGITPSPASNLQINDPDMRTELENLRREVERMRQDREVAEEAPPLYDSVLEQTLP